MHECSIMSLLVKYCRMLQDVQGLVWMGGLLQLGVPIHRSSFLRFVIFQLIHYIISFLFNTISKWYTHFFSMQVSKIKQMMLPDSRDGPVRPVIRTFYDHLQVTLCCNLLIALKGNLITHCWFVWVYLTWFFNSIYTMSLLYVVYQKALPSASRWP